MYCIKCGVKLADTEQQCPLCLTRVYHPDFGTPSEAPLYPQNNKPVPQFSPWGALVIVTTIFLLPLLITLLCDLQVYGSVTWSGYVIGALMVIYISFVLPHWFRKPNPVIFVPCAFAAVALYLLYINLATGGRWFLSFAFPMTGAIGLLVTAMVVLLKYLHRGRLYIFGGASIILGLLMPLMEFLLSLTFEPLHFGTWSFYPMIVLVLFGGMLIFLAVSRNAREVMERKFFL